MTSSAAVRDVLLGIEAAFEDAGRRRLDIVRQLSRLELDGADADARRDLIEALLRREAADRDADGPLRERVRRTAVEARAAGEAAKRLGHREDVARLLDEHDGTWGAALNACDRLAGGLRGRAPEAVVAATAVYVAALRGVHEADARDPQALEAAATAFEDAHARLEAAIS